MSKYSYIGVAEDLNTGTKFIVSSTDHSIHEKNIVMCVVCGVPVYAEVIRAAFLRIGSDEEAMLAEFGEIYPAEKIYGLAWEKKEEVTEDGN